MNLNSDQFAEAGLSPTDEDAASTVVHLADSIAFNHKHGAMHLERALEVAADIEDPKKKILMWNLKHATKHSLDALHDVDNLIKHVQRHPLFKDQARDLANHELGVGRAR